MKNLSDNYKTLDSEWNFALAYFKRLDECLRIGNFAKGKNDFKMWLEALLMLHDELSPQMEKEEAEDISKLKTKCIRMVKLGNNSVDVYTMKQCLSDNEVGMRMVMKRRGMDMPRKSDPGRALLG